jgi:hypothetical protein
MSPQDSNRSPIWLLASATLDLPIPVNRLEDNCKPCLRVYSLFCRGCICIHERALFGSPSDGGNAGQETELWPRGTGQMSLLWIGARVVRSARI